MSKQLTTFNKVHEEENSELILENVIHRYDKWMFNIVKNFFLQFKGSKWIILNNNIFSNAFHCINFLSFNMLNLENFTESSFSDNSNKLEIF